jgi:hypothetical protein
MDYAHLGRTGLKVSRLALGTMNFGELTDEADLARSRQRGAPGLCVVKWRVGTDEFDLSQIDR